MLMVRRGARPFRRVPLGAPPLGVAEFTPDPEPSPGCARPRLARRTLLGSLPVLGGVGLPNLTLAAASPTYVACLPSGFRGSVHAVFGHGAAGAVAAEAAAAACRSMSDHEEPGWLAALGGMQSGPDVADAVLASEWSFSVLCCDGADEAALSGADTVARQLTRRGHMVVMIVAGPSATPLMASIQATCGRHQPARLLLPVQVQRDGLTPVLTAAAATLLSSVGCQGIVGVDASDIWSAIGGPGPGVAVHAAADRGQEAAAFGRSVVSSAYAVGVGLRSVRRLLISVVLPPGWHLRELDQFATTVVDAFDGADTAIMSAVLDPAADTASVLLVCS